MADRRDAPQPHNRSQPSSQTPTTIDESRDKHSRETHSSSSGTKRKCRQAIIFFYDKTTSMTVWVCLLSVRTKLAAILALALQQQSKVFAVCNV